MGWKKIDPERLASANSEERTAPSPPRWGPYREPAAHLRGGEFEVLERSWRSTTSGSLGFLTFFTLLWNTIVWSMVIAVARGDGIVVDGVRYSSIWEAIVERPATMIVSLFVGVGLVLAYIVLAIWVNRTRIRLSRSLLRIERGPLPWRHWRVEIDASDLRQIYVEAYSSHSENDEAVTALRVMASRRNGAPVCIDRGIATVADARRLEAWIEQKLRIKDRRVPGEVPRD